MDGVRDVGGERKERREEMKAKKISFQKCSINWLVWKTLESHIRSTSWSSLNDRVRHLRVAVSDLRFNNLWQTSHDLFILYVPIVCFLSVWRIKPRYVHCHDYNCCNNLAYFLWLSCQNLTNTDFLYKCLLKKGGS